MLPILYTAELDLADADKPAFFDWFASKHVPDLQASGFGACACYRSIEGGMDILDLYELKSVDVFKQPRYVEMGSRDPYASAILGRRTDKSNTVYTQRMLGGSRAASDLPLDADWVSLVRFDAPPSSAAAFEAALRKQAPRLGELGAFSIRFAERGPDHPTHSTHRPRFLALADWAKQPPAAASLAALLEGEGLADITNIKPFTGYRVYPWPDDASLRR
jgi:hypothetical protein